MLVSACVCQALCSAHANEPGRPAESCILRGETAGKISGAAAPPLRNPAGIDIRLSRGWDLPGDRPGQTPGWQQPATVQFLRAYPDNLFPAAWFSVAAVCDRRRARGGDRSAVVDRRYRTGRYSDRLLAFGLSLRGAERRSYRGRRPTVGHPAGSPRPAWRAYDDSRPKATAFGMRTSCLGSRQRPVCSLDWRHVATVESGIRRNVLPRDQPGPRPAESICGEPREEVARPTSPSQCVRRQ